MDASQRALIAAQISDFGINNDGRGRPRKAGARDKAGRLLLPLKNPDRPAKQAKYPAENRLSEVGVGQGKGKRRAHIGDGFGMDIETAATLMNVSIPTIRDAKHVLRNGSPGLIAAVQSGTASVSAGKEFSVLPKEQQDKILKSGGAASVSVMGKRVKERRLNKRRIERAAGAETKSAIFDHIKIGDGRSIGNITIGEVPELSERLLIVVDILLAASGHVANAEQSAKIRSVLNENSFAKIVDDVRRKRTQKRSATK